MLEVVGHGVAVTVSALAQTVELHMRLMIGDRVVLGALYSVSLLPNHVDQAKGVAGRLKGIKVRPVSDLALEVLVTAPQGSRYYLTYVGGVGVDYIPYCRHPSSVPEDKIANLGDLYNNDHFFLVAYISKDEK